MGTIRAAKLETSERLQRALAALAGGAVLSTLQWSRRANICACNAVRAELVANGQPVKCERRGRRWFYSLSGAQLALVGLDPHARARAMQRRA